MINVILFAVGAGLMLRGYVTGLVLLYVAVLV